MNVFEGVVWGLLWMVFRVFGIRCCVRNLTISDGFEHVYEGQIGWDSFEYKNLYEGMPVG